MEQARSPRSLTDVVHLAYTRTGASSSRQLEGYAKRHGFALTHTTINQIMSGTYPSRPKEKTLRALAFLSGIEFNQIRVIVGLPPKVGLSFAEQLPPDVDELGARPRAALVEMARVLLDLQRKADESPIYDEEQGISVATLSDLGVSPAAQGEETVSEPMDQSGDTRR